MTTAERSSPTMREGVWLERAALLVLGIVAAIYLHRLDDPPGSYGRPGDPPVYVHDECYQAFTAGRYARGDREAWDPYATRATMARFSTDDLTRWTAYEWIHPPTAKLVMAGLIGWLGFRPGAYRLGSVAFGLLAMTATWLFARRWIGARAGLVALALVAADGMVFVLSRVAMNDVYVTACGIACAYAGYRWWTEERARWLLAAGAALALGLTMKWSIAPLGVACATLTIGRIAVRRFEGALSGRALRNALCAWTAAFVALPPAMYLLSYVPYFAAGYGWSDLVRLHGAILRYHANLAVGHPSGSQWWEWPLVTRPVWFFARREPGASRLVYAMGNPLLWWAFLPALAWSVVRFVLRRDPGDGAVLIGFCSFWLPWAFVERVAFAQYLLPAVPFGALSVARALEDLAGALGRPGRAIPPAYAAIVVATFIHFHPFWSAQAISDEDLAGRRYYWFDAWRPASR